MNIQFKLLLVTLGLSVGLVACDKGARPDSTADNAQLKRKCYRGLDVLEAHRNSKEKLDINSLATVSSDNFDTLVIENTLAKDVAILAKICNSNDSTETEAEELSATTSVRAIQVFKDCEALTATIQGPLVEGITGSSDRVIVAQIVDADLDSLKLESVDESTQEKLDIKVSRVVPDDKNKKEEIRKRFEKSGEGLLRLTIESNGNRTGKLDVVQVYAGSTATKSASLVTLLSDEERTQASEYRMLQQQAATQKCINLDNMRSDNKLKVDYELERIQIGEGFEEFIDNTETEIETEEDVSTTDSEISAESLRSRSSLDRARSNRDRLDQELKDLQDFEWQE